MKALVIDGYNAINKVARLAKLMDRSLEDARRGMVQMAEDYKRAIGGVDKVQVVFDGRDEYRYLDGAHGGNKVFSGTGGGDALVIKTIAELSNKYHVIVVSDDNYIRNHARVYNATAMSVAEFERGIAKKTRIRKPAGQEPRLPQDVASKINEELKRRWGI